ncbi:Ubiquitin carboxyl-terminal hydrolase 19 [Tyrophagus putrescentiae]|nr:Ubiquitin carboxyl-terminal hydrolase 19 [Tyrophagus putrescentiae]
MVIIITPPHHHQLPSLTEQAAMLSTKMEQDLPEEEEEEEEPLDDDDQVEEGEEDEDDDDDDEYEDENGEIRSSKDSSRDKRTSTASAAAAVSVQFDNDRPLDLGDVYYLCADWIDVAGFPRGVGQLSFNLRRLPPILVVQLKRFKMAPNSIHRRKLGSCDSLEEAVPPPIYDLYAVVNHMGEAFMGHYTAYARAFNGEMGWRHFDDSSVSDVTDESRIVSHNAYLLFYKRREKEKKEDKKEAEKVL